MSCESILLPDMPAVAGLVSRMFRDEADYLGLVDVINNAAATDNKPEEVLTVEVLANAYAHVTNCDLHKDMLIAEVDGQIVAYASITWSINDAGERIFGLGCDVHSSQRDKGIGRAMLRWQERRAREIAVEHPDTASTYLQTFTRETTVARKALLESEGYTPVRYAYMMVRPIECLTDVPVECPLPEGLEVRAVQPEHMRLIWEASNEAFRDHWDHRESTEVDYQRFLHDPDLQPHLWQVAWDARTNEVAGMVLNQIYGQGNEQSGIKRGWTDNICVRRPWRRRGLARALIMRSLKVLHDQGMTEAALGVDVENPSNALRLYESCGYRVVQRGFTMRKAM